jgi:hypothetical protein
MKKIYMSPTMDVIELKHQQTLLAGSVDGFNSTLDNTGGDGGNALAPEYEWWDWQF